MWTTLGPVLVALASLVVVLLFVTVQLLLTLGRLAQFSPKQSN